MVEKLEGSLETNNAGLSLLEPEEQVGKAMSKSEEGTAENEHDARRTGDETESESGSSSTATSTTTQQEGGEEDNEEDTRRDRDRKGKELGKMVQQREEKEGKVRNSSSGSGSMERGKGSKVKSGGGDLQKQQEEEGREQQQQRAKGENGRILQTGTSSESSIKTTPEDSSLETPSNFESDPKSGGSGGGGGDGQQRPVSRKSKVQNASATDPAPSAKVLSQSNSSNGTTSFRNTPREKNNVADSVKSSGGGGSGKNKTPSKTVASSANTSGNNSNKSLDSGPLNIRALPFESGINTECIQLLRQLWNVHEEAVEFLACVHRALCSLRQWVRMEDNEYEESLWDHKRLSSTLQRGQYLYHHQQQPPQQQQQQRRLARKRADAAAASSSAAAAGGSGEGESGNELRWIPLQPFIDGLKCISDNVSDIEKQCLTLSVFHSQCKLILYAKIHHARRQVTHDRLEILHGVNQLVCVASQLLSSPSFWLSSEADVVTGCACTVFHLSEMYNACLESCWAHVEASLAAANPSLCSTPSEVDSGSDMGTTVSPSKIRVLTQVKAANRNDSPLLKQSLKPLTATKLLQVIAQRRAIFSAVEFTRIAFSAFYEENREEKLGVDKFSQCLENESLHLSCFERAFSKRPSILGRAALKESETGELRLAKSFKLKMYGYFHEVLWSLVGEYSEDLILWSLQTAIPLTLQPPEMQIALRKAFLLGAHAQVSSPTPLLAAFETIGGALHSFSLMVNWDEKMREAFEITFRVKRPEHVTLVTKPEPSQWATEVGSKFGEILSSCISLMEAGNTITSRMALPLEERQRLASVFGEEEPLGDEAQILFRLEATLNYFRAWTVRRAKVWLNSWAVSQFIACSQRDPAILVQLIKSKEVFLITREVLLKSENIAIRISARNRQMCSDDAKTAIQNLSRVPDELLVAVGMVCRTLSLATLQTYMPDASHWRGSGKGSGLDPDKPSSYVRVFIERVVEPVFKAAVTLVPPLVQESLGKQVINAMCDAWLHYILQKKIKFSEWGAVQLLRDFVSLREWIRNQTELDSEAKKALLQLEILKSCEGVAYLLLRNPGDVLGVGKPSNNSTSSSSGRKSRRVAPAGSHESSPSPSEESTAEDAIPPEMYVPNQQMWLQLRLKKTGFSACCNF